jgi:hypothetical protein
MSSRRYPPAYLRYLKARLWNLARPGFWGTAIFLSVVGLGIKEYWTNPNFLTFGQKKTVVSQKATDTLSAEDKAIAADIDNLPVLINDIQQAIPIATTPESPKVKNNKNLLEDILKSNSVSNAPVNTGVTNAVSVPKPANPFLTQADNLLQIANPQNKLNSSTQSGVQTTGDNNRTNSRQNTTPVNALQTALNQADVQNLSRNTTQTNTTRQLPTDSLPNQSSENSNLNRNDLGYTQSPVTNFSQADYTTTNGSQTFGTTYTQPTVTNNNLNNPQTFGTTYTQPTVTDNNLNNPQTFGTTYTQTTVNSQTPSSNNNQILPVTPTNSISYPIQTPSQNIAPSNSVQSIQNPPLTRPTPGMYGGMVINGNTYP